MALIGIVRIQAQSKLTVIPHLTAETLFVNPTPIIAPVTVCVVETGILNCSVIKSVIAPAVSAATPSNGVTFVILVPIVFTRGLPGKPPQDNVFLISQTLIRDASGWHIASILPIANTQLK